MKKILLSLSALLVIFVSGCGGGSNDSIADNNISIDEVDNSLLADDLNEYGYIGEAVIFGDIEVSREWRSELITGIGANVPFTKFYFFENDGTGYYHFYSEVDGYIEESFIYGVSRDGKVIYTNFHTITINTTGHTCYGVAEDYLDGGGALFTMCPLSN